MGKSDKPWNLAKHIAKMHKPENIRIARIQVNCPLCNNEYSNMNAILAHLQIRTNKTTWKPTTCNVLTNQIITEQTNTVLKMATNTTTQWTPNGGKEKKKKTAQGHTSHSS